MVQTLRFHSRFNVGRRGRVDAGRTPLEFLLRRFAFRQLEGRRLHRDFLQSSLQFSDDDDVFIAGPSPT